MSSRSVVATTLSGVDAGVPVSTAVLASEPVAACAKRPTRRALRTAIWPAATDAPLRPGSEVDELFGLPPVLPLRVKCRAKTKLSRRVRTRLTG